MNRHDSQSVVRIKSEILASASGTPISDENCNKESNVVKFSFPYRLKYIDFSDLVGCTRIPKLVCFRQEFEELDGLLEEFRKTRGLVTFVTGTPGTGLHLNLLCAPFLHTIR